MHRRNLQHTHRGISLIELVILIAVIAAMLTVCLPSMARLRGLSGIEQSKSNLVTLSIAHATYAADNNNRQYTSWPDNFGSYGGSYWDALVNLVAQGHATETFLIGWNEDGLWRFTRFGVAAYAVRMPIALGGTEYFGAFRVIDSCIGFNEYVNGRFFDPVFYAPNDAAVIEVVEPFFDSPWSYAIPPGQVVSEDFFSSSYARSPAALFNPVVLRRPSEGGYHDPFSGLWPDGFIGFVTPPLHAAAYPDLKTHIIEHHWLQNGPAESCNPAFGSSGRYDGCEPYYFNHSIDSEPATLFYDGHVRLLPNSEVQAGDQAVLKQTRGEDGLWSRDTPYGSNGYLLDVAHDLTIDVSHHILTTDGILGRDTLGPLSQTKSAKRSLRR